MAEVVGRREQPNVVYVMPDNAIKYFHWSLKQNLIIISLDTMGKCITLPVHSYFQYLFVCIETEVKTESSNVTVS